MKANKIIISSLTTALMLGSLCSCVNLGDIYQDADEYTAGNIDISGTVEKLDIDWKAGSVTVSHHDKDTVSVTETCETELSEERQVHTWLDGNVLHIRYCKSGESFTLTNSEKKLEVKVPMNIKLTDIDMDGASCDAVFDDISADTFNVDMASGTAELKNCTANIFDLDSASGGIILTQKGDSDKISADTASGKVDITAENVKELNTDSASGTVKIDVQTSDKVDIDTASGDTEVHFANMPKEINFDAASGDITMYTPKNPDITIDFDTASGDFNSDISFKMEGKKYISGTGENKMKADTASGDLYIKEAE
jgi:DUF4097 and DUF4098 domain-containing protein YvlB